MRKSVFDKKYEELTEKDKDLIIYELGLDKNSPMFKDKEDFILFLCKQEAEIEYFGKKGYTMPKLVAGIDDSKTQDNKEAMAYILTIMYYMRIKPTCVFLCDGGAYFDFHSVYDFHFNHWSDYLNVVITFIEYLEELKLMGINLEYREPFERGLAKKIDENAPVLKDASFTEELFNNLDDIEFYGKFVFFLESDMYK